MLLAAPLNTTSFLEAFPYFSRLDSTKLINQYDKIHIDFCQNASKIYRLGLFSPRPNYLKLLDRVSVSIKFYYA